MKDFCCINGLGELLPIRLLPGMVSGESQTAQACTGPWQAHTAARWQCIFWPSFRCKSITRAD